MEAFSSSGKLKLKFFSGRQKAADYVKILNDFSRAQEGRRLCEEEWIFQQDNATIHNFELQSRFYAHLRTNTFILQLLIG